MEGRINGRRGRGRPRTMWTDNIKEWTKISYNDCIRVAQDRERWRSRWYTMMMMMMWKRLVHRLAGPNRQYSVLACWQGSTDQYKLNACTEIFAHNLFCTKEAFLRVRRGGGEFLTKKSSAVSSMNFFFSQDVDSLSPTTVSLRCLVNTNFWSVPLRSPHTIHNSGWQSNCNTWPLDVYSKSDWVPPQKVV